MAALSGKRGTRYTYYSVAVITVAPGTQQAQKAVIAVFLLTQCPTCVAGTPQGQVALCTGSIQRMH